MTKVRFAWNRYKDNANFRNHGVSFDEAKTVFMMIMPSNFMIKIILLEKIAI